MSIDRCLVFEQPRFSVPCATAMMLTFSKFRSGFAPIAMGQDFVPPDFAARLNFAARRHRLMEQRIETRYPHSGCRRLHVLEERSRTVR